MRSKSLFVASQVHRKAFVPKRWYSISLFGLDQLGAGKWYDSYTRLAYSTRLNKDLNRGLFTRLRKRIFDRREYLWEKRHPTDIFTAVRHKIADRLLELDKNYQFGRWHLDPVARELDKTVPPGDPWELFGEEEKGKFLGDKIDFIGKEVLFFKQLVVKVVKTLVILAAVWLGWKLVAWILG